MGYRYALLNDGTWIDLVAIIAVSPTVAGTYTIYTVGSYSESILDIDTKNKKAMPRKKFVEVWMQAKDLFSDVIREQKKPHLKTTLKTICSTGFRGFRNYSYTIVELLYTSRISRLGEQFLHDFLSSTTNLGSCFTHNKVDIRYYSSNNTTQNPVSYGT